MMSGKNWESRLDAYTSASIVKVSAASNFSLFNYFFGKSSLWSRVKRSANATAECSTLGLTYWSW